MTEQPKEHKKGGARLEQPQSPGVDPEKKKKHEKRIMVIMIILAVIMAIAAAVAVFWTRWIVKPNLPSPTPTASGNLEPAESRQPEAPEISEAPADELAFDPVEPKVSGKRKSEDFYTVLIFGSDVTSGLTDTIMVGSYDITNQRATLMSIPRDTLVNVRSSYKLINGVYSAGGKGEKGIERLMNEVSELVGFLPDYYVMIDWELVGQMVDAIGGVDYNIPFHMGYEDDGQDLHISFEPGLQHLDGQQAMELVRWRKNNDGTKTEGGGGDTSRLDLQHDFLKSVLKQTLQIKNVTRVGELAELFGNNVVSDLSVENMFWFASQAILGGLSVDNVNFVTMPHYGVSSGVYAGRIYPNQKELLKLINESLNPYVADVTIKELDLIRVSSGGNTLSSSTGKLADPSAGVAPKATDKPSATTKPDASESPDPTASPAGSDAPVHSSLPTESSPPAQSNPPAVSEAPAITEPPVVSEAPLPTEPPPESTPDPVAATPEPVPENTPDLSLPAELP